MSLAATFTKGVLGTALDIVYPVHCVLCGEFGDGYLCENCAVDIPEPIAEPVCARCGHHAQSSPCSECVENPPDFVTCFCAGQYSGNLMEAIHWMKYRDRPMLAEPLGRILAVFALQNKAKLNNLEFDAVVPVPMHPARQRLRGYNHAERLANVLGEQIDVRVDSLILRRTRITKPQVGMTGDARRANLKGAFKVKKPCDGKTILLIDDVSTTGSTLRECASVLTRNGARSVFALTLAAG